MIVNATVSFPDKSKFILIDNFFEESDVADINQLFYSNIGWQPEQSFFHFPDREIYCGTSPVLEQIKTHAQLVDISSVVGTQVELLAVHLWKDQTITCKMSPHYDVPGPDYAVQIYMGENCNTSQIPGTAIYADIDPNATPLFELGYRPNSGYIIDAPHTVLHGINHKTTGDYKRYSVYLLYRKK